MRTSLKRRKKSTMRWVAALALASMLTVGGATAANAAPAPASAPVPPASDVAADTAVAVQPSPASPDYAAGTYYYVCVYSNGSTLTLLQGVKVTTCHGSYLQQWLESGQKVKTYALSLTGKIVKPSKISAVIECMIAVGGTAVLMIDPPTTVPTLIATTVADAAGLVPCVSD